MNLEGSFRDLFNLASVDGESGPLLRSHGHVLRSHGSGTMIAISIQVDWVEFTHCDSEA